MPKAGDILDLSPIGAIFHIRKTAAETQGRSFEMEWELAPQTGGTPVHIHPHASESYEVIEGALDLYMGGTWRTLSAGEKATVDPGVAHTFRNATHAPTRVYNIHAPAMKFGEYFEGLHRIVRSGVVAQGRITPKAILYLAVLMTSFRDEIRTVKPPDALMRVFAVVGRLMGYRVTQ
ncbi:MAG: cupin domain-containing protein [Vicinamibacterales bacterium]